jgi:hypothetical protein
LPIPRWQGLRLVAADGSAVRLTLMKDGVRSIVQGVAFGLYLPGIELFLDFRLFEPLCDERQMLFEAIDNLRADDVLLLDRGFPCRWLVSALTARGTSFCIRCDLSRGFKAVREFMRSGQSETRVVLRAPDARDAADDVLSCQDGARMWWTNASCADDLPCLHLRRILRAQVPTAFASDEIPAPNSAKSTSVLSASSGSSRVSA